MSSFLLIVLGVYLAACYLYGMYVVMRLLMVRTTIRATSRQEPTELIAAARAELERNEFPDERRVAA